MANVMLAVAVVVVVLMVLIQAVKHIILRIRLKVSAPLIASNASSKKKNIALSLTYFFGTDLEIQTELIKEELRR